MNRWKIFKEITYIFTSLSYSCPVIRTYTNTKINRLVTSRREGCLCDRIDSLTSYESTVHQIRTSIWTLTPAFGADWSNWANKIFKRNFQYSIGLGRLSCLVLEQPRTQVRMLHVKQDKKVYITTAFHIAWLFFKHCCLVARVQKSQLIEE